MSECFDVLRSAVKALANDARDTGDDAVIGRA